ncbi:hypothetical protein BH20ACT17_BH20ACT17_02860 [soil metagenome]
MDAGPIRSTARSLRLGAERARFELWAKRLDARLRRAGGRLALDAPHGAHFHELPRVEVLPYGGGDGGTFTLRLGRHVQLGRGLILEIWAAAQTTVEIGDEVTFLAGTRARVWGGSIRIGQKARIRDYCFLDANGELALGAGVQLGSQVALHAAGSVELADNVTIGERTSFFDSDHRHDGSDEAVIDQPRAIEAISIGANAFIGANSLVLRGARVGANASIAGASVVRRGEYPGGFLYAGSPLEAVRPLARDEQASIRHD